MDHLERIEDLISAIQVKGVPEDYLLCKLFEYSLATESFRSSWIRFKSYQRDCPHHGFNEVQLLNTFFRGIVVQYKMALDASSDGNFNTRNPEEAVRVIENLASSNITKNTEFERKRSASILGNDQIDEARAKLDSVHNLLRKQACLVEDAEAVDTKGKAEVEEDVNFISGT